MAVIELEKVGRLKSGFKLLSKDRGVVGRNAETDGGTNVTKDGVADGFGHLGGVLVGDGEVEAVFASLRKDDSKGIGSKVLELVHVEIEGATVGDIRDIRTAHSGELDFGNEEGAQDAGVVFANQALGKVDDEDLAFVHDFADVKTRFRLSDDVADDWVGGESTDLVKYWSDTFVDLFFVPLAKFVFPELQNSDISTIIEGLFAEVLVCEQA